jgi:hypothetical protein
MKLEKYLGEAKGKKYYNITITMNIGEDQEFFDEITRDKKSNLGFEIKQMIEEIANEFGKKSNGVLFSSKKLGQYRVGKWKMDVKDNI